MNYSELFLLVEETFEGNSWNEIDQILYPSCKFNVPQFHPCVASGDSDISRDGNDVVYAGLAALSDLVNLCCS